MCGGTNPDRFPGPHTMGLSPRVRGNLVDAVVIADIIGSIPACAGEPHSSATPPTIGKVYPRVCGGTRDDGNQAPAPAGLSPRVRGNLPGRHNVPVGVRSIPACAGEPEVALGGRGFAEVYPRVCGGTTRGTSFDKYAKGLSPRVRGNRVDKPRSALRIRSIPACAGEPLHYVAGGHRVRLYPRVCGGTSQGDITFQSA